MVHNVVSLKALYTTWCVPNMVILKTKFGRLITAKLFSCFTDDTHYKCNSVMAGSLDWDNCQ